MKNLIIVFCFLIIPKIVFTNGATFGGSGSTVFPIKNNKIELISEELKINAFDVIDVNCLFVLHNTGDDTSIQMGFPVINVRRFKVTIDGKTQICTLKEAEDISKGSNLKYEKAYIRNIDFKRNETKKIYISYRHNWSYADGTEDNPSSTSFGYILTTGKLWKGNIKKADIIIDVYPKNPTKLKIQPSGYTINGNKVEWRLLNFEPTEDISIIDEDITSLPYLELGGDTFESFDGKYWRNETSIRCSRPGEGIIEMSVAYYLWDKNLIKLVSEFAYTDEIINLVVSSAKLTTPIARLIRNEIYARHGYIFKSADLQNIYSKKSWYKPNKNFSEKLFNHYELRNIKYLKEFEEIFSDTENNKFVDLFYEIKNQYYNKPPSNEYDQKQSEVYKNLQHVYSQNKYENIRKKLIEFKEDW